MQFRKPKPIKKPAIGVKKVTVSLPPGIVDDLDFISSSIGLSRSAFLSSMLSQSLPSIKGTLITLQGLSDAAVVESEGDSEAALQRYNSTSKDAINEFIQHLISGGQDDLFNRK